MKLGGEWDGVEEKEYQRYSDIIHMKMKKMSIYEY